jgi:hypothetical protein
VQTKSFNGLTCIRDGLVQLAAAILVFPFVVLAYAIIGIALGLIAWGWNVKNRLAFQRQWDMEFGLDFVKGESTNQKDVK